MSLSYHPLHLANMSIRAVAVHRELALPIPLRHDTEFIERPVAAEPVPGLLILNQPIDPPEGAAP
jgi:hypothetical protein